MVAQTWTGIRLSLCTPWRLTGEWLYSSIHPCPRHTVEVNGQFHAPEKKTRCPLKRWQGGWQNRSGWFRDEINPLTLPGIEPWFLGHPPQSSHCADYATPALNGIQTNSIEQWQYAHVLQRSKRVIVWDKRQRTVHRVGMRVQANKMRTVVINSRLILFSPR